MRNGQTESERFVYGYSKDLKLRLILREPLEFAELPVGWKDELYATDRKGHYLRITVERVAEIPKGEYPFSGASSAPAIPEGHRAALSIKPRRTT